MIDKIIPKNKRCNCGKIIKHHHFKCDTCYSIDKKSNRAKNKAISKNNLLFDSGVKKQIKDELQFLDKMKIALIIIGDEVLDGMEDGQIEVLNRIKFLKSKLK